MSKFYICTFATVYYFNYVIIELSTGLNKVFVCKYEYTISSNLKTVLFKFTKSLRRFFSFLKLRVDYDGPTRFKDTK